MAGNYTVKNGECLSSIAYVFGVPWEEIWNHAQNAALKQKRASPSVLRAGDVLFIPDYKPTPYVLETGKHHRIVYKRPRAKLRLRVVVDPGPKPPTNESSGPPASDTRNVVGGDPEPDRTPRHDEPRKALAYKLVLEDRTLEGTTDGDGYVDCDIPANASRGKLILAPGTPDETAITLNLGHLDPIDEVSGVKQRLRNLCIDCGDQSDEETPGFTAALRAFQTKHGLDPSGLLDNTTRNAILKAHGT
jgi:hypothetical protein